MNSLKHNRRNFLFMRTHGNRFPKVIGKLRTARYNVNMVTIYDIAQESGFAAGTVSKALNNYYGVNQETRRKILQVAQRIKSAQGNLRIRIKTARS